jgi:hypothetical protein
MIELAKIPQKWKQGFKANESTRKELQGKKWMCKMKDVNYQCPWCKGTTRESDTYNT